MMGEYDAGYENYIDSLIREIEKLQDENDKLSEQVSNLVGRSFRTADKMSCIEADNAKLRELVRELWRTMDLLNACDVSEYDEPLNCIYCEQWGTVGKNIVGCKLKYRMCELGVDA